MIFRYFMRAKETMLAERWQGFTFLWFSHGNKTQSSKMSQLARHAQFSLVIAGLFSPIRSNVKACLVLWLCSLVYLKSITMHEAFVLETGQLKAVCKVKCPQHFLFLLSLGSYNIPLGFRSSICRSFRSKAFWCWYLNTLELDSSF